MGKKQIKEAAQDEILHGIKIALNYTSTDESAEVRAEMMNLAKRIAKQYGYDPETFNWST